MDRCDPLFSRCQCHGQTETKAGQNSSREGAAFSANPGRADEDSDLGWSIGQRSVMERKDAVPNEVTRKEGTWEKERGRDGEKGLPQRNLISKWIGQPFLPLSLHFLLNQFFSAVVTLSRRPIDSPERKGGGNPIFLFSEWCVVSRGSLGKDRERKCVLHIENSKENSEERYNCMSYVYEFKFWLGLSNVEHKWE